jgi:hypothetical protein
MNDSTIFGQLIQPKEVVKLNTTIQGKIPKDFLNFVKYHQFVNGIKIDIENNVNKKVLNIK